MARAVKLPRADPTMRRRAHGHPLGQAWPSPRPDADQISACSAQDWARTVRARGSAPTRWVDRTRTGRNSLDRL